MSKRRMWTEAEGILFDARHMLEHETLDEDVFATDRVAGSLIRYAQDAGCVGPELGFIAILGRDLGHVFRIMGGKEKPDKAVMKTFVSMVIVTLLRLFAYYWEDEAYYVKP